MATLLTFARMYHWGQPDSLSQWPMQSYISYTTSKNRTRAGTSVLSCPTQGGMKVPLLWTANIGPPNMLKRVLSKIDMNVSKDNPPSTIPFFLSFLLSSFLSFFLSCPSFLSFPSFLPCLSFLFFFFLPLPYFLYFHVSCLPRLSSCFLFWR